MHGAGSADAATTYIELDTVNRELGAAHGEETDAARMVEIEQERAEAGVDPLNDLLQAKLSNAEIRLKRIHLGDACGDTGTAACRVDRNAGGRNYYGPCKHSGDSAVSGDVKPRALASIESARLAARSRLAVAKGDQEINYLPQLSFAMQYNRNTTLLNNADYYYKHDLPASNFSSGFSIQVPLFDMGHRAKAREIGGRGATIDGGSRAGLSIRTIFRLRR